MGKDENNIIIFILIILVVFGIGYYYSKNPNFFKDFLSSTAPFFYDPYLIEEDFNIPSPSLIATRDTPPCQKTVTAWEGTNDIAGTFICEDNRWRVVGSWNRCGGSFTKIESNQLILASQSNCAPSITVTHKINLKNKDIKLKAIGLGISFGGNIIFRDGLVEILKDVTDKNRFVVLVNGEPIQEFVINSNEAYLSFTGVGTLYYIKSKPYFSCETDNNEVWVSDSFGESSTFDIHSLTYEPTKFCPEDYPAVVRDFRERGTKADLRGTITERLTRGEKFTVPTFQSYEIRYATLYKEGMGLRCDINEVYDTKLKKCIAKIFEQDYIIKDCHSEGCPIYNEKNGICMDNGACAYFENIYIEKKCQELGCPTGYTCLAEGYCLKIETNTIYVPQNCNQLGCPSNYDCLPEGLCVKTTTIIKDCKTESCPSGYTCLYSGLCSKSIEVRPTCTDINCNVVYGEYCEMRGDFPVCVRPYKIVEVIRDREYIIVGKNQKSFTDELIIGNKKIIPQGVSADTTCLAETTNNNPKCFTGNFEFDGKSYSLKYGEKTMINDYFEIISYSSGRYDFDDMVIDLVNNNGILSIKNFDFLKTEAIKGEDFEYYVIKDSKRELCFNLVNNLGISFNNQQAGYSLLKTTDLVTMQTRTIHEKEIPTGKTNYCIPIDSTRYGEIFYKINPYFKIGNEQFFDDEQIIYNYKIVDKIPENETIVYKAVIVEKPVTTEKIINQTTIITIKEPFSLTNIPIWVWIGLAIFIFLIIILSTGKR